MLAAAYLAFASTTVAQTADTSESPSELQQALPSLDGSRIEGLRARIDTLAGQNADTRDERLKRLTAIESTLANAKAARQRAEELRLAKAEAPAEQSRLRSEIETLRDEPAMADDDIERLRGERQSIVTGEITEVENQLNEANTRATRYSQEQQTRAGRAERIRTDLTNARNDLDRITDQLQTFDGGADGDVEGELRRLALLANRDLQLANIARLEADNTSLTERGQTLQLRAELVALQQARLTERLKALQGLTGQLRLIRGRELLRDNLEPVARVDEHPLVNTVAAENDALIDRYQMLARNGADLPDARAQTQAQLSDVTSNLAIATQLTELGDIQRAGETLRRLRANLPVLSTIRAGIETTRELIIESGTEQLLAQEQIRQLPARRADPNAMLAELRRTQPDASALSPDQTEAVDDLMQLRRTILESIQEAATDQADDAAQLKALQDELVTEATELQSVLDSNLLKARSAEPVLSVGYPAKVVRGSLKLAQPTRLGAVLSTLRDTVRAPGLNVFFFVVMLGLAGAFFAMRSGIRDNIAATAVVVRKVREDGYFITPRVALESTLLAAPPALVIFAVGYLIGSSGSSNPFVLSVATALRYLALFVFSMLSLRAWAQKDGLFERHIRIPEDLRRGIQVESRWFVPLAGVVLAIVVATHNSRDVDIYEGVSLTAFIVAAVSLGVLEYRLIQGRRQAFTKTLPQDGALYRYRHVLAVLLIGIPFVTAIAAALGYYSTSEEVLVRFVETLVAAIVAFVLYGVLRRTINITHRRLSLKQAMEKREAALAARRKKLAEERETAGEENPGEVEASAPPPVDYEQIDLEETSRQTRQLMSTAVVILFLVAVWFVWRDLLPALSVFDSVELYQNGVRTEGVGDAAIEVTQYITLWDLIQALVTVALTVLAARNLPGFLEIFVLNRTNLETGVRYAIVTILGYVIVAIGIFTALNQLGVQWGQLGFIVAALGVGIGFGLQEIIANFISGIIILFERPIRVGDYVSVGDQSGTVSNIRIRATTLTDLDNKEILIPNKEFITTRVTNWTLTNSTIRVIIPVGIAYGSDTRKAQAAMLDVLKAEPKVLDAPAPQVIFVNFGDSSLDFELRVFIRSFEDRFPVINAVHTAINLALEREGIGIPFPQRDLHLVSADGIPALQAAPKPKAESKAEPKPKLSKPKAKPSKA